MEITELFYPATDLRIYSLIFLLGSLSVSSLSDLKRMAAQTDFAEVWWAFTGVMFAADAGLGTAGIIGIIQFIAKWAIIFAFAVALTSNHSISISTMDIAALCALMSCLDGPLVVIAAIGTFALNEMIKPLLSSYGDDGAYPFLPTVLAANVIILALELLGLTRISVVV